jgi:hypothetical protein
MRTTTMHFPQHQPNTPTGSVREHKQTLYLGTFAEGQRAVRVTVTYSPDVGSFASVARKQSIPIAHSSPRRAPQTGAAAAYHRVAGVGSPGPQAFPIAGVDPGLILTGAHRPPSQPRAKGANSNTAQAAAAEPPTDCSKTQPTHPLQPSRRGSSMRYRSASKSRKPATQSSGRRTPDWERPITHRPQTRHGHHRIGRSPNRSFTHRVRPPVARQIQKAGARSATRLRLRRDQE